MLYLDLLDKLEKITNSEHDLQDCTVTANKINGISFLLIKDPNGDVFECIILEDKRHK